MQFGTKVKGKLEPVNQAELKLTNPYEIFQLDFETQGIPDEESLITELLALENKIEDFQLLYIETNKEKGTLTLQFADRGPGQISFAGVFGAVPALALLAGVLIVGIILWQVYSSSNSFLLVPLIVVGGVVALFLIAPSAMTGFRPVPIRTQSYNSAETAMQRQQMQDRRERRIAIQNQLKSAEDKLEAAENRLQHNQEAQSKIDPNNTTQEQIEHLKQLRLEEDNLLVEIQKAQQKIDQKEKALENIY